MKTWIYQNNNIKVFEGGNNFKPIKNKQINFLNLNFRKEKGLKNDL